jgi:hypothetical protein
VSSPFSRLHARGGGMSSAANHYRIDPLECRKEVGLFQTYLGFYHCLYRLAGG